MIFIENPKSITGKYKEYILRLDNNRCRLCGYEEDLQIHHLTPKILGGNNTVRNLITLCVPCHGLLHFNPILMFRQGKYNKTHSELTKEGLSKAKTKGKEFGRPKKDPKIYTKFCFNNNCRIRIKEKELFCKSHKSNNQQVIGE